MMSSLSVIDILLSLCGLLSAGVMVVAGVVAFIALRNLAAIVLLAGTILGLLNTLFWTLLPWLQRGGVLDLDGGHFMIPRLFGTFAWMLTGLGVLLVALAASGLRRQNQALESIMAGSQTDRVA